METIDLKRTLQVQLEEDEKLNKLILITFSRYWNLVISLQCYVITIAAFYILAHDNIPQSLFITIIICDIFYIVDFVASVLYMKSLKIQRFLPHKVKDWKLIFVDFLSLIPAAFAYETYVAEENKIAGAWRVLIQNRTLRIYRVLIIFNSFDLTVRDAAHSISLMLIRFALLTGLVTHLFTCIWKNIPQSKPCTEESFKCLIWQETKMLSIITHHWSSSTEYLGTTPERLLVIFAILSGVALIYGDFLPQTLLLCMRISGADSHYFQKYVKLERYLKNISVDEELNEKIQKYFRHFWQAGTTGTEMEKLTHDLPLALKKEIFTDIYWDAFRHSDIFRDVSRSCKRTLSLFMTTEYCQEGDVVCSLGKYKERMIYLVGGILELMAEENATSPIMSFSSGTVIGEISLFMTMKSYGIVKCRTLCEIQTLNIRKMYRVLANYPKDKNLVFQKLNKRLVIAKITQWRKRQLMIERRMGFDIGSGQASVEENEDCVKWVKTQWRAIWESHERHTMVIKAIEGGLRIPAWRKQHEIQSRLDAVSNYMDLMVLSDVFEEKKDVVCLKTNFPWAIDPKAEFLVLWKVIVVCVALIVSILYPFVMGWLDGVPNSIVTISIGCSLVFEIDLALRLMTAVKTKHGIITDFWLILVASLKKPTFYMDILAALPLQLYLVARDGRIDRSKPDIGFLLLPAVFKSHVFLRPKIYIGHNMVPISIAKNIFIFILLIFWFAALFQISAVRCLPQCNYFSWRTKNSIYDSEWIRQNLISLFIAIRTALSLPEEIISTNDIYLFAMLTSANFLFFFWQCFFMGDFYTVYSIKISNKLRYNILFERIVKYLEGTHIPSAVQKRIIRTVRFQWVYNKADDLLTKTPIIALAPSSLRREIYANGIYPTLRKCPLFHLEPSEFIYDIIDKCSIIAVPSGTILVSYGLQSYRIHMLHKGYCQINSFLQQDVLGGLGAPILIGPGYVFPTLAAFVAIPVPISVISLTDCEVVVLPLEDLLKTMVAYDSFRDLVQVLYRNNYMQKLSNHVLAMIRVNVQYNLSVDKKAEYEYPFKRLGCCGKILRRLMLNNDKSIYFDQNQQQKLFLKIVCYIYITFLVINAFLWPLSFGLLAFYSKHVFFFLLLIKIYALFYIYIQFHVPYFDSKGLLITHPLYTSLHYITTHFFFDLIINFPYYTFYRLFVKTKGVKENTTVVITCVLQKMAALVPINGFFNELLRESQHGWLIRPGQILLNLMIILNGLVNYEMFYSADWTFDENSNIIGFKPKLVRGLFWCMEVQDNKIIDFYTAITFWLFGHLTANNIICEVVNWREKAYSQLCSLFGTIMTIIFYGWLASQSAVSDALATIYQERMKSFVEFLVTSKTEDKIVENSIGYFEHQWSRSRGQNLKEISNNLPKHLQEELSYSLYRPTMGKTGIFANADEGFYRLLSTHTDLVHYNRGSVILFKGQVQSDIFFIHKGKCFVYDWFLTLEVGSMIGDLNHTGVTENKVFALTHVELLRISADTFFAIINNFYDLEKIFKYRASHSQNFIKSAFVPANQLRPVDSRDVLNAFNLQSKDLGFEDQSFFEDPENIATQTRYVRKQGVHRRYFKLIIYPGTIPMIIYNSLYLSVAFLTTVLMPTLLYFGSLSWITLVLVAVLDGLWIISIIITFRVGVEDKIKGDIITDAKFIAKAFVTRWDGLFLNIIACLPFEFIPILLASSLKGANKTFVSWLRAIRLIRVYYLVKYLHTEVNKLKVSSVIRYISVLIYFILYIHILILIFLMVTSNKTILSAMKALELGQQQFEAIVLVYEYVVNLTMSANIAVLRHTSTAEIIYFELVSIFSIYVRALIIKNILSIKYISSFARGQYKTQVTMLESNLKRHELSPSILKEVLDYKLNLLIATRSESMPTFLLQAPTSLQIAIMTDLYLFRLSNSPIFREIRIDFLKLLVSRVKRQLYFPGQKIVEKGDVDNTMYFIHKGEVYVVDQTEGDAYIEYIIDRVHVGDQFGEAQGIAMAKPHKFTYRARTVVEMLTLTSDDWIDLRKAYPQIFQHIVDTAMKLQY